MTCGAESARVCRWRESQEEIARCGDCCGGESGDAVSTPLQVGEIPEPPNRIRILFIGVAPTPLRGRGKGTHFYSLRTDPLRLGLFSVLDSLFATKLINLNSAGKGEAEAAFHNAGFFFVHAAKVRPKITPAPPAEVIAFCARRHLIQEICILAPKALCFLGSKNTAHAIRAIFGRAIDDDPQLAPLDDGQGATWEGSVAVAHQPRRGWNARGGAATSSVIGRLKARLTEQP